MTPSGGGANAGTLGSAHFRAVIGVALFIMFGFGLIVPTLPLFAREFGVGEAGIGLLISVFGGTRLAGDLVTGGLIDRYGERMLAAAGAAIVGVSSLAAGFAPNFGALVALRGIGGIGSAFFLGGLMAHLIGSVPAAERGRAMGAFQSVLGIGFLLGPVAGGLIAAVAGMNAPLLVYGGICLAAAPLVWRAMGTAPPHPEVLAESALLPQESPPAPPEGQIRRRVAVLIRDSAYRAALVASAATFFTVAALQTLTSVYWEETLAQSTRTVGVPFMVNALASLVVLWHAGALSDRRGRKVALVPALAAGAIITGTLGFVGTPLAFVLLMAAAGLASGYMRPAPSAIVADVASASNRGAAVAGYRFAGDLGGFIGPLLTGVVAEAFGPGAGFLVAGGALAATFFVAAVARETAPAAGAR